jgi:hypothetical protein
MNADHHRRARRRASDAPSKDVQTLHFTARITIAGQVIVVHTDAPSRATAIRQLDWLKKNAAIALLENH